MQNEYKLKAYRQLMKYKKIYICLPLLTMISVMTIIEILNLPIYILIAILAVQLYISTIFFYSINICPWCGLPFFIFGKHGLHWNGMKFVFQKKCINCQQPDCRSLD